MGPVPKQFTGIVTMSGGQTFLLIDVLGVATQALLLMGPGPSVAQQIAAATAAFAPVVGTLQTIRGVPTNFLDQFAILVV